MRTSDVPGAGTRVLAVLPGLRGHRCDNGRGATFADELADTELAHLLEHAALEIMALAGSPDTLRGRTTWDFPADGRRGVPRDARLRRRPRRPRRAAGRGGAGAGGSLGDEPAPDVAAEVARLRALRACVTPPPAGPSLTRRDGPVIRYAATFAAVMRAGA